MKDIADAIREIIDESSHPLSQMREDIVSLKVTRDKWSKKEILGHLIDSAANNHQRIVRACYHVSDAFPPYDQNEWVRNQYYQEADWTNLVTLWLAYNNHLCYIIERVPVAVLSSPCNIGKTEPVTLEFIIKDYLRHLNHHVKQILEN